MELAKIESFENLLNFQKLLNETPDNNNVKINKMANNSKYLPINLIERKLDEFYSGLWQTKNFQTEVIANEIAGSIELLVFNPLAKEWITRTGTGAVMIQTSKGQPATVENKIKNTLVKDYPHLKAECIKNAAKSLGVIFGRNLNRDDDNNFESLAEKVENKAEREQLLNEAYIIIDNDASIQNKDYIKMQISKVSNDRIINYINNNQNANTDIQN